MSDFADLRATLVAALREERLADDEVTRKTARRWVAETVREAREHFTTADGRPDSSGQTSAFRDFLLEVFIEAGWTRDELANWTL